MSTPGTAVELLAIGSLGLVATLGIFLYELRNSQLYAAVVHRARFLEGRLGLPSAYGEAGPGGPFTERPGRSLVLFHALNAWHDRGLALVYAASLAGWSYLVAWGAFAAAGVPEPRAFGGVAGAVVGVLVILQVERLDIGSDSPAAATPSSRASGV